MSPHTSLPPPTRLRRVGLGAALALIAALLLSLAGGAPGAPLLAEPAAAAPKQGAGKKAPQKKRADKKKQGKAGAKGAPKLRLVFAGRWSNRTVAELRRLYRKQVRIAAARSDKRALRVFRAQRQAAQRAGRPGSVVLVIDTKRRSARQLERSQVVREALASGAWLVSLDTTARKRGAALKRRLAAGTHGRTALTAARLTSFAGGRPHAEVIDFLPLGAPNAARKRGGAAKSSAAASAAPRPARGGAKRQVRRGAKQVRHGAKVRRGAKRQGRRGAVAKRKAQSAYARRLYRMLTRGGKQRASASAEGKPAIPDSMLTARWRFTTVGSPKLGWPSKMEDKGSGTQWPMISVTQTFTAYLSNEQKVSPGGPGDEGATQYVYYELDGHVSPVSNPNDPGLFLRNPGAPNWVDDRGWWTAGVNASIKAPPQMNLLKSAPSTPNSITQYTSGTSFSIGFAANAGKSTGVAAGSNIGASVNASFSWNDTITREIPDWGVRSHTTGRTGAWQFFSKSPCDYSGGVKSIAANDGPRHCYAAAKDTGLIWNHQKPLVVNDLSASSMDFHANALWQTSELVRGTVRFEPKIEAIMAWTWWNGLPYDKHPNTDDFQRTCPFRCKLVETKKVDGLQLEGGKGRLGEIELNLGAVVPVPVESITFHEPNQSAPLEQPLWVSRSLNTRTIDACVTLSRPAPATLRLPVGSTNLENFWADGTMAMRAGDRRACFPVILKGNRLAECEAITAEVGAFYAAPNVVPLTIRSGRPEQCAD